MLLSCAKEEIVRLWAGSGTGLGQSWTCLQSITHPAVVNAVAWCSLPGQGPKPLNMFATYVQTESTLIHERTESSRALLNYG